MQRETSALETLSHPSIPKFIEGDTEFYKDLSYQLYFASEFIHGQLLSSVDFSVIDLGNKIELIIKLAQVVNYFH